MKKSEMWKRKSSCQKSSKIRTKNIVLEVRSPKALLAAGSRGCKQQLFLGSLSLLSPPVPTNVSVYEPIRTLNKKFFREAMKNI
jgi:hypothetical protein